ncbi:MAG: sigma-70 family RNA polymerase sigma factor [Chloroflexia bacterium]
MKNTQTEKSTVSRKKRTAAQPPVTSGRDDSTLDAMGVYLREIGRIPLLTAAQEVALAMSIESGRLAEQRMLGPLTEAQKREALHEKAEGDAARRTMIESNLKLVVSIARRYGEGGVPLGDLIEEGNIGLMRAVEKFDYRKGFRFSTYATWWVRQAVSRGLASQARTVRLPVHINEMMALISKVTHSLTHELGREPTMDEIAAHSNLTPDQVRDVLRASQAPVSLEQPYGKDGEGVLGEMLEDHSTSTSDEVATRLMRESVHSALKELDDREQRVLMLRYGLGDDRSRTLAEVGKLLGLTRERIRQIEGGAQQAPPAQPSCGPRTLLT